MPDAYRGERPEVTVFNHDAWSRDIKALVNEVLDVEYRISAFPVVKDPDYNFMVHHIDYTRSPDVVESLQQSEYSFDLRVRFPRVTERRIGQANGV